jgi:hypothetical protein
MACMLVVIMAIIDAGSPGAPGIPAHRECVGSQHSTAWRHGITACKSKGQLLCLCIHRALVWTLGLAQTTQASGFKIWVR